MSHLRDELDDHIAESMQDPEYRAAVMAESWIDKQGDVWRLGDDGLMHTPETRPFPREYVERKWGPLRRVPDQAGRDEERQHG